MFVRRDSIHYGKQRDFSRVLLDTGSDLGFRVFQRKPYHDLSLQILHLWGDIFLFLWCFREKVYAWIIKNNHSPAVENYFIFGKFFEGCRNASDSFLARVFSNLQRPHGDWLLARPVNNRDLHRDCRRKSELLHWLLSRHVHRLHRRFRPFKCWKQCVMPLDNRIGWFSNEITREDFHI